MNWLGCPHDGWPIDGLLLGWRSDGWPIDGWRNDVVSKLELTCKLMCK